MPWMVSLQTNSSWHFCGGALISATEVVTAAHCVGEGVYQVRINAHDIVNGDDDGVSQVVIVNHIYRHVAYNDTSVASDIAVLVLAEAVTVTTDYALWHGGPGADSLPYLPTSQDTLTVSGWGALEFEGSSPSKLQTVDVFAWTNAQCSEGGDNAYSSSSIDSSMLCAGDPYPGCTGSACVDSCQGDSGGPLVATVGDGSTVLVGVVSWGYGCASGFPGVYARVLELADFVGDYTNPAYGEKLCINGENTCGTSSYIFAEDSYGDMWDGAELSVKTCAGTVLLNKAEMSCLSSEYFCFDNAAGELLTVTTTKGDYPDEISWTMFNENGADMSGGAPSTVTQCPSLISSGLCGNPIDDEAACEEAATSLGLKWSKSISKNKKPRGCITKPDNGKVWFNTEGQKDCKPGKQCICESAYGLETSGSCANGIDDEAACEAAADSLGLEWVKSISKSKYPGGCFTKPRNNKVWFNDHAGTKCKKGKQCICEPAEVSN